ncbi:hypothetical protein [Aureliella helgolandensis]|uniref:Uncharacterized protein n=1 Tax=Aureliella helgolandensis TaxID=2527968 RepID=A0A518GCN1_9BACT|nr:hypothetical protein [Aureliella helgolandensis]QDV26354.1 hypothetical protein Q31a_47270 [Aureliella helgolandensis]
MSGTHTFYNGVLMRDCELIEFAQVVEYDESQTDPLYSRFRLTVASTLVSLHSVNGGSSSPILMGDHQSTIGVPPVNNESVVDRLRFVHEKLSQPRGDFWYALNAVSNKPLSAGPNAPAPDGQQNDSYRVVLAAAGIGDYSEVDTTDGSDTKGGRKVTGKLGALETSNIEILREDVIDMNNGPKPMSVNVVEIHGGRAMRVQFTIEVCRPICPLQNNDPSAHPIRDAKRVKGVISNRWAINETLNEDWSNTIVIEGTLIVSDQRFKPDAMRLMTSTAMFPYAKMKGRQFFTSSDGLKLKYRYTMQEAGVAPPPHIVDWSGTYIEKVENGGHCTGSMNVMVRGQWNPPNDWTMRQYKLYLSDWLFHIIQSRLTVAQGFNTLPGNQPDTLVVNDFTIVENMKEPVVEAQILVTHANAAIYEDFALRLHNFGKDIIESNDPNIPESANYDPKDWPIPAAFAWDVAGANHDNRSLGSAYDCYFQSPCSEWHGKPRGLNVDFDVVTGEALTPESGPVEESASFASYIYQDTSLGAPSLPAAAPPSAFAAYGWSDAQVGVGFTYLHVEIDNHYNRDVGKIALPLSKPRNGTTVVFASVHAGIETRTFTMVASRQGDWPKVPEPKAVISNSSTNLDEHLMHAEVLPDAPKLLSDGRTWEYSVQVKWVYALSRTLGTGDTYRASSDPRDKTTPVENAIQITNFFETTGAID